MADLSPILISTDFDGTIFLAEDSKPFAASFFNWISETRKKRPVHWVINTGRAWPSLSGSLLEHLAPIWPDWVVLIERSIHRVENRSPISLDAWNQSCQRAHDELFSRTKPLLAAMLLEFEKMDGMQIIDDLGSPFGLIAKSEEQADEAGLIIRKILKDERILIPVRNSIYFRFAHRDFNKGTCLNTVREQLGLEPSQCFAIGDHYNDLPMLSGIHASHVGCPSNAVAEVQERVRNNGGFVASQHTYLGVVEALEYFFPLR